VSQLQLTVRSTLAKLYDQLPKLLAGLHVVKKGIYASNIVKVCMQDPGNNRVDFVRLYKRHHVFEFFSRAHRGPSHGDVFQKRMCNEIHPRRDGHSVYGNYATGLKYELVLRPTGVRARKYSFTLRILTPFSMILPPAPSTMASNVFFPGGS
jgi:hypothetical protein